MTNREEQDYLDFIEVMRSQLNDTESELRTYKLALFGICVICSGLLMVIIF